jgi:hypothetical protein
MDAWSTNPREKRKKKQEQLNAMTNITVQQARTRYTTLPPTLQDAIFSIQNAEIIASTIEKYHLPDEKAEKIPDLVGSVLLGFLHPEDLSDEIVASTGMTRELANDVSSSFMSKIFSPIKPILDQSYKPVPELPADSVASAPQIIEEVRQSKVASTPPPKPAPAPAAPAPKIISETFSATAKFGGTPLASNRDIAAPAPQAPKPGANAGWSKSTPQQPVVKLGAITATAAPAPVMQNQNSAPKTISMPTMPAAPAAAKPPVARSMSEFERLDLMKKSQAPTTAQPATPPQPAPVMLHEVSSFAPIQSSPSEFNTKRPAQDQLRGTTAQGPMPARPVVVEFGGAGDGGAAASPSSSPSALPKPVHYTEYQAPIPTPPAPMANTGPRQMTEIQAPQAPTPPAPPAPPQKGKIIVKDFLGPQS